MCQDTEKDQYQWLDGKENLKKREYGIMENPLIRHPDRSSRMVFPAAE